MWYRDKNIYARAFSKEGIAKADSFLVHSGIQSYKKQPTVLVNGNKVFFTWSDARNEGCGYDIYGSIFDLSKVVSVDNDEKVNLPNQFSLSQNYPNPFNPTTKIKFTITTSPQPSPYKGEGARVRLKVFDILGKEIATLVNEEKPSGEYVVEFDGSNLSSGVYFYQLSTYGRVETMKLILMK
ncbi:MAG: T9SS C-terminal target domain-containing protein [Ignavibacteriales bacterium]|nr:MAG: T9SS C-terminal target domain-containing protein [Ignavibacteriales bacterium]